MTTELKLNLARYDDFMRKAWDLHKQFVTSAPQAHSELARLHEYAERATEVHSDALSALARMRATIDQALADGA